MAINLTEYTIDNATDVSVSEFRDAIDHLEAVLRDRSACVCASELERWSRIAKRIGTELIGTSCKRATVADWMRRERAIDRSTQLIAKVAAELGAARATTVTARTRRTIPSGGVVVSLLDYVGTSPGTH